MGMFDSFMIQIDGHPVELQTKRFDRDLAQWRPGDVVGGAPPGIRVYFDHPRLDGRHRVVYDDAPEVRSYTVFVVLVQGVFTVCEVVDGKLEMSAIQERIEALKATWSDSVRAMSRWTEFLSERQGEVDRLQRSISRALWLIDYARRPRADTDATPAGRQLLFPREEEDRLDRGEDVLDVLRSVLETESPERILSASPRATDALDEFRL